MFVVFVFVVYRYFFLGIGTESCRLEEVVSTRVSQKYLAAAELRIASWCRGSVVSAGLSARGRQSELKCGYAAALRTA